MRLFETLILVTLFLTLIAIILPVWQRRFWLAGLPLAALLFTLIHLVFEGYRWQMAPAYGLAVILFGVSLWRTSRKPSQSASKGKRVPAILGIFLGLLVLVVATALPLLFPVFQLPAPGGPYAVGSTLLRLVDESRAEALTADPDDRRELLLQVWYPAQSPGEAVSSRYWPDAHSYGSQFAGLFGLPAFLFDHLDLVKTHTYPDLPLASEGSPYPVILFSPGYCPGFVSQNRAQMEELASHGYVVFSIGHTYEVMASYPDGRAAPCDQARVEAILLKESAAISPLLEQRQATTDPAEKDRLLDQILAQAVLSNESVQVWSDDTIFVMDQLEQLNAQDGRLAGKLDLARIGLFGMSFGGATVAPVCLMDERCRAGLNLDGFQFGELPAGTIDQPFMIMYSQPAEGASDFIFDRTTNVAYRAVVAGANHMNYSDYTLFSPLFKTIGFLGPIEGQRMARLTSAYTLAFFNRHLKGEPAGLLEGTSAEYPEVKIEVRNP